MSKLNGTWNIVIKTYIGDQRSTAELYVEGNTLNGKVVDVGSGNSAPIFEGKVDGDKFSFKVTLKIPVGELTMDMSGELVGDELKGKSVNPMGEFEFIGTRV